MTCFHGIYPWAIFNSTWSTAMNICVKIVYYYADHHRKYTALWTLFPSMHISKTKNRVVTNSGVNKKTKRSFTKDLRVYHRLTRCITIPSSTGKSNYVSNWADQSSYWRIRHHKPLTNCNLSVMSTTRVHTHAEF